MINAFHVLRDTILSILKIKDADHASRIPNAKAEILPQSVKGTGEKTIRAIKYSYALKKKHACKIYLTLIFRGGINSQCEEGYTGVMCNSCIQNQH
jgi:hypothetical protein